MTDRIAALATLSLIGAPEREAAFGDFYSRYRDEPLIVDKWFALQAASPDPSARSTACAN
jgi:aminopeptidase N